MRIEEYVEVELIYPRCAERRPAIPEAKSFRLEIPVKDCIYVTQQVGCTKDTFSIYTVEVEK